MSELLAKLGVTPHYRVCPGTTRLLFPGQPQRITEQVPAYLYAAPCPGPTRRSSSDHRTSARSRASQGAPAQLTRASTMVRTRAKRQTPKGQSVKALALLVNLNYYVNSDIAAIGKFVATWRIGSNSRTLVDIGGAGFLVLGEELLDEEP